MRQSSPKREMTWWTPRSTSLQNFIALRQPTPKISVTKNPADRKTNKQTVSDISPTCLSACGDNSQEKSIKLCRIGLQFVNCTRMGHVVLAVVAILVWPLYKCCVLICAESACVPDIS